MEPCRMFSATIFVLFFLTGASAHIWEAPFIPENRTNVIEEWKGLDKELKSMTSSIIKSVMPMIMESTGQLNLTLQCSRELFQLIAGLKGLKKWAFQFVDSSAKMMDGTLSGTMSFLGVYKECINTVVPHSKNKSKVLFRGQYCTADIRPPLPPKRRTYRLFDQLEALENFTGSEIMEFLSTKAHLFYFQPFKLGLCIPSGCTKNDLNQMLSLASKRAFLDVNVTNCEIKESKTLLKVHVAAITVCCILGGFVLLGTGFELYLDKNKNVSKRLGIKFLMCFSLITNFKRLVSTKTSTDNPNLKCFHGFRFLSITWIVYGHAYFFSGWFGRSYSSLFNVQETTSEVMAQMIVNGSEAVDSFMFMSGCLLSYITMKHVKVNKKKFNLKAFFFHRLWRIIPTYYFIILFAMLTPLMGSGPLFQETMMESIYPCYQFWWRNLLFINNFYHMSEYCMLHTWYVSCDMQLYIASLLVILPLLRWERIGLTINVVIVALSVVYTGTISALMDLPSTVLMIYVDPADRSIGPIYTYSNPLSRAGPYFVGIFLGYILATRPSIKIPKKIQVIGWCLAILSSGSIIFTTAYWYNVRMPSSREMYAYAALFKVAFSSGVAWMIFCCCTGHGGFINHLLSWSVWVPLSKLAFLIYLIQPILQNSYIANFHSTQEYTHFHFIMQFFGFLCISSLLAMVANLLVESPFMAMEKLMRPPTRDITSRELQEKKDLNGETNFALEDIKTDTCEIHIANGKVEANGNTDIHWTLEKNINENVHDSQL